VRKAPVCGPEHVATSSPRTIVVPGACFGPGAIEGDYLVA
jgi:hypothetical protein